VVNVVRFLPYEDAILKAYKATRNRFYGFSQTLPGVESRGGEALPTIWLNGQVIGWWEWTNKKNAPMIMHVTRSAAKLNPHLEQVMSTEASKMQQFLEASHIIWEKPSKADQVPPTLTEASPDNSEGEESD